MICANIWNAAVLPRDRVPASPRISARFDHPGVAIESYYRRRRRVPERGLHFDLVTPRGEIISHFLRDSIFQVQHAGIESMIVKRTDEVQGLESRCFDCFLHVHPKLDYV